MLSQPLCQQRQIAYQVCLLRSRLADDAGKGWQQGAPHAGGRKG